MPGYLLLIYEDEARMSALDPADDTALAGKFKQFMRRNAAVLHRGERLFPTSSAVSVRTDPGGGVSISDGAFVEAKEVVAGYFLIEADDLAQAVDIASQVPVRHGGIEVRPIRPTPTTR